MGFYSARPFRKRRTRRMERTVNTTWSVIVAAAITGVFGVISAIILGLAAIRAAQPAKKPVASQLTPMTHRGGAMSWGKLSLYVVPFPALIIALNSVVLWHAFRDRGLITKAWITEMVLGVSGIYFGAVALVLIATLYVLKELVETLLQRARIQAAK